MRVFKTKDELVDVLSALWDDIFNTPAIKDKISAEMVAQKIEYTLS